MRRACWAWAALTAGLTLALLLCPSRAVVRAVLDGDAGSVDFAALPALFGVPLPPGGVRGYLTEARPANACQPIQGPRPGGNGSLRAVVLIRGHGCALDLKVLHAQRAGFAAAIVHDARSDEPVRKARAPEVPEVPEAPEAGDGDGRRPIAIPAVFVDEAASRDLRVLLRRGREPQVLLLPEPTPSRPPRCRPALATAWTLGCGLASAAVALLLLLRRLGLWALAWWGRAPSVKTQTRQKAEVRLYTRHSDLCAICLDDYEEGDRLKILPCAHAYHCACLDPWLAQAARRACPLCKRPVASSEDGSDSASDSQAEDSARAPIWAIQARLRLRAPGLLARAPLRPRCSATSLGPAEDRATPPGPGDPPDAHGLRPEGTQGGPRVNEESS